MANVCGECARLDMSNKKISAYDMRRCPYLSIYVGLNDRACKYFIKKEKGQESGCFITTAVVTLLGDTDNSWILNTLRSFRNEVMQYNPKYYNLLLQYEVIGPKIAVALAKEHADDDFCVLVCQGYLIPICRMIENGEVTQAVNMYIRMVKFLQNQLSIIDNSNKYTFNDDTKEEEKGHGRARVHLINKNN